MTLPNSIHHFMNYTLSPILVIFVQAIASALAYNGVPKIFVDLPCIEYVDPLLHGFSVVIPQSLLETFMDPGQLPVLYATAVPLQSGQSAVRKMVKTHNGREDKLVTICEWIY